MSENNSNPFSECISEIRTSDGQTYKYFDLKKLKDERVQRLPYSIRVLLESCVRNADGFQIQKVDVEKILNWAKTSREDVEIPFKPARVLMQDFTGVPAVVDLAAMREAVHRLGGDPNNVNPQVPADLVIDHSVQVDFARSKDALARNLEREMERNSERFQFLKWGAEAFKNLLIVPPGGGIVHQVNLEYLARVVFNKDGVLYPDSLVGTDSHTTMINGLGVTGWGVGGIEAEAVMMGTPISMVLPQVIGYRFVGKLPQNATATDLVLTATEALRKRGVVGKFVEFFGPGLSELSLADRATLANMAPEYGATMGFFPPDSRSIEYLRQTGRDENVVEFIEAYLRANEMFIDHEQGAADAEYTDVMELDLSTVVPSVAGPKRPHDRVAVSNLKDDFAAGLVAPVSFKGFAVPEEQLSNEAKFTFDGQEYVLRHGDIVIAAITSCTNTSNPSVMLGAGLLAKNAVERGLSTLPYVKTSLGPGSGVVTKYLEASGLQTYLDALGFSTVGYGCTTCIGNSGDLHESVSNAIVEGDLVATSVLSGNRNFEGRVHPLTRANYLASPPLVVAYAIAGNVQFDFDSKSLGTDKDGNEVFLRDIWPSNQQIQEFINKHVLADMFKSVYANITAGTERWNELQVTKSILYPWSDESTYIHHPPFFQSMSLEVDDDVKNIENAYVLLNLGDSITTDHISPAGKISRNSPAAEYLKARGVKQRDFNTYGSRRGNDEVMVRGTFANIRLVNKFCPNDGPKTLHVPSGEVVPVFDAAKRYSDDGSATVIFGGSMYGSGSSRDWAAKGVWMQGVSAVIAKSFERIHRSNLVGMGVLPCVFMEGEDADSLGLTGHERVSMDLSSAPLATGQVFDVTATSSEGNTVKFQVRSRLDTDVELAYYKHGGILNYVIRKLARQ